MASRQAIFGVTGEHGEDNEKLVELFKNRAELKKEFAALNKEKYRLQQMIKEQQGATARIVQRLEHLENLLVDAEWREVLLSQVDDTAAARANSRNSPNNSSNNARSGVVMRSLPPGGMTATPGELPSTGRSPSNGRRCRCSRDSYRRSAIAWSR